MTEYTTPSDLQTAVGKFITNKFSTVIEYDDKIEIIISLESSIKDDDAITLFRKLSSKIEYAISDALDIKCRVAFTIIKVLDFVTISNTITNKTPIDGIILLVSYK